MRTILMRSSLRSRVGPLLLLVAVLVMVLGGGTTHTNTLLLLLLVIANLPTVLLSLILILCVTGTACQATGTICLIDTTREELGLELEISKERV
jgi:hypothetical protein